MKSIIAFIILVSASITFAGDRVQPPMPPSPPLSIHSLHEHPLLLSKKPVANKSKFMLSECPLCHVTNTVFKPYRVQANGGSIDQGGGNFQNYLLYFKCPKCKQDFTHNAALHLKPVQIQEVN